MARKTENRVSKRKAIDFKVCEILKTPLPEPEEQQSRRLLYALYVHLQREFAASDPPVSIPVLTASLGSSSNTTRLNSLNNTPINETGDLEGLEEEDKDKDKDITAPHLELCIQVTREEGTIRKFWTDGRHKSCIEGVPRLPEDPRLLDYMVCNGRNGRNHSNTPKELLRNLLAVLSLARDYEIWKARKTQALEVDTNLRDVCVRRWAEKHPELSPDMDTL